MENLVAPPIDPKDLVEHNKRVVNLLEGASNFVPYKLRLQNLFEMVDLWYLLENVVTPPKDHKDKL